MSYLQTALARLATWTVSGVLQNIPLVDLPTQINDASLPALFTLLGDITQTRSQASQTPALAQVDFSGAARYFQIEVTHLLLIARVDLAGGGRSLLPSLVQNMDAYINTLQTDLMLNGLLARPLNIICRPGVFQSPAAYLDTQWANSRRYFGCAFVHQWHVLL